MAAFAFPQSCGRDFLSATDGCRSFPPLLGFIFPQVSFSHRHTYFLTLSLSLSLLLSLSLPRTLHSPSSFAPSHSLGNSVPLLVVCVVLPLPWVLLRSVCILPVEERQSVHALCCTRIHSNPMVPLTFDNCKSPSNRCCSPSSGHLRGCPDTTPVHSQTPPTAVSSIWTSASSFACQPPHLATALAVRGLCLQSCVHIASRGSRKAAWTPP